VRPLACEPHTLSPQPTHAHLPSRPQERANLAEQTLRQKEALLAEKERFQSDVQHFSQDLQKLARETSGAVEGRLQQQLAAAQEQLFEEKRRRADAEGEAQVQRARLEQAQREVDRLQRSLAARDSLVQQLKAARLTDTPAREVRGLPVGPLPACQCCIAAWAKTSGARCARFSTLPHSLCCAGRHPGR
jgi:hypothetical protein